MLAAWRFVMMVSETDYEDLQKVAESVILSVGDMIIDHVEGYRGFLTKRIHHIDMIEDDIYLWEIKLFKTSNINDNSSTILEEDGLKLSIAIGTIEWHSVTGGTLE
jgi:hypothetical protein